MAKLCASCSAPLREGAKFCSSCGAPVLQDNFCSQCGSRLEAGDRFCSSCGAPVGGAAPAPKAEKPLGRPKKKPAPSMDPSGFYGVQRHRPINVSDRAIVFTDGPKLYRVDRELNATVRYWFSFDSLYQTESGILAVIGGFQEAPTTAVLCTLDDSLKEQDRLDLPFNYDADLDQLMVSSTCVIHRAGAEDGRDQLERYDLATGEVTAWTPSRSTYPGDNLTINLWVLEEDDLYLWLEYSRYDPEEQENVDCRALVRLNTRTWEEELICDGKDDAEPRYLDLERKLMWTHPTMQECESRGLDWNAMVARKLKRNARILKDEPVWQGSKRGAYLAYFDGKRRYLAEDYHTFRAVAQDGSESEPWCNTGHGRAQVTVIWGDYVLHDLDADYQYFACPAQFDPPARSEWIPLEQKD